MTRKKVKLAFITNDAARKATFKKRKKGLMKKVAELSTLCGIEACAVVYSPFDPQPEVWPSPMGLQRVLSKFRRMPELEQSKKMVNQESFLKQRMLKAKEQVKKQAKENREKEMTQIMFQYLGAGRILHNISMLDLNDMAWLIEQTLKEINRRLETLNKRSQTQSSRAPVAAPAAAEEATRSAEKKPLVEGKGMEMNADTMYRLHGIDEFWWGRDNAIWRG